MHFVTQPRGSYQCGQACVAMVAHVKLHESIRVFGHRNRTYPYEIIRVLKRFNIPCSSKYISIKEEASPTFPKVAIIQIKHTKKKTGHSVVYNNGLYLDPSNGIFKNKEELFQKYIGYNFNYYIQVEINGKIMAPNEIEEINQKIKTKNEQRTKEKKSKKQNTKRHVIQCVHCGHEYKRQKKSKIIVNYQRYWCHICGEENGKLEYKGYI